MSIKTYIDNAILKGEAVTIKYIKYSGECSTRMISDIHYSNEYGEGDDYIEAYCHKRQERRTFKISRIVSVDGISDTPILTGPKHPKSAYTGNSSTGSNYSPSSSTDSPIGKFSYKPSYPSSNDSSYSTHYSNSNSKKGEGCYIATMAYGDYGHPQVMVLRQYRDNVLKKNIVGRLFVSFYYKVSPILVHMLSGQMRTNNYIRQRLDKLVYRVHKKYGIC